jgi:hypothetical protein
MLPGNVQTVSISPFTLVDITIGLKNNEILLWSHLQFCLPLLYYPEVGKAD